ncbi:class I SAM-dependent methyltransferase [Fodinibius halophilus]|uniref:Class I SAM-dependent methyltransferase n=1 Tax=Fodinibius halophilus TaxID=1736908 RepID=A0A6M1T2T8_9BACT|nr:class I SAM-dependent methyltransferase [Fodinibius halophilus]NGP89776.1 class I SAM-dependent methyltransferase [Fodinibius halophilus]
MSNRQENIENEFRDEDLQELASQLCSPEGEKGVEVAQKMEETNISMTLSTIDSLSISDNDTILEIGHGNCSHLDKVLNQAEDIRYHGLEISETMKREAERINRDKIDSNLASFHLYDGLNFPFEDLTFNHAMTVNTIYFWEKSVHLLNEVFRVLKPGGSCSIGFAQKSFMKQLPFAEYGFNLFNTDDVKKLVAETAFQVASVRDKTEQVTSKSGDEVEREYTVITLTK